MSERMRPRGPDGEGVWEGPGVALGHRRLAILDLDQRANQPMVSADGRYVIVFNGEIYNFGELRRELEDKGAVFLTTSDTEVLLALFVREGDGMLPRLRGMFAFAIWDTKARELFLARDPYGIKPLYYSSTPDLFVFASQVKAIIASGTVSPNSETAGLAGFYLWGSVPEPWTMYRGIYALPAGHWAIFRGGRLSEPVCWSDIRRYWQDSEVRLAPSDLEQVVRESVKDSVRAHLVSDVPVSVFLSGGIDSAVIAGLALEAGARVQGITIGFEEFVGRREDEVPVAAGIAEHYGLSHFVRRVSRDEFERDIPQILDAMDQPSIDGVNTWFASKAASERGYKVVLSGVGGDELFLGYSSFSSIPKLAKFGRTLMAMPGMREMLKFPCDYLARARSQPKFAQLPEFMDSLEGAFYLSRGLFVPGELPSLMGLDEARDGLRRLGGSPHGIRKVEARDGCAAVALMESTYYLRNQVLRDGDWASMRHSLELRTPLCDIALLAKLGPLISGFRHGRGKVMLAQATARPLPAPVIERPKTGFGLPMAEWLQHAAVHRHLINGKSSTGAGASWARRWASSVVEGASTCV